MKPTNVTLEDNCSGDGVRLKKVKVKITQDANGILINPEGYGGDYPVLIEVWKGQLRVVIWGDAKQEDPTHIISLEGARDKS